MSRWYPRVDTGAGAEKAARVGSFAAVGFAVWLCIPALRGVVGHDSGRTVHPIEVAILGLLISLALLTAWRFRTQQGWIVGPVLMVALIIELAKRIALDLQESVNFSVIDTVIATLIFFGLVNGVRGARARRYAGPDRADAAVL